MAYQKEAAKHVHLSADFEFCKLCFLSAKHHTFNLIVCSSRLEKEKYARKLLYVLSFYREIC